MTHPVRVCLFDHLSLEVDGAHLGQIRSQKGAALLAYMAYFQAGLHLRSDLIELLWPDGTESQGRSRLSSTLWLLSKEFSAAGIRLHSVLTLDRMKVALAGVVKTDVAEFEGEVRAAALGQDPDHQIGCLGRAIALYRGELLRGSYENWVLLEQTRLATLFDQACGRLADLLAAKGDLEGAIEIARRGVRADRASEPSRARLIRLYYAAGQPDAALGQYRDLERLLAEEYARPPDPETRALIRRSREPLQTVSAGSRESALVLPSPGGAVPLDSPAYVPRGTDRQLAEALARRDSTILVQGAAQCGKSSLLARGLQAARENGASVAVIPLEVLERSQMASLEAFLCTIAGMLADQLGLTEPPVHEWPQRGANLSLWRYIRTQVLADSDKWVVWALDDADRLFGTAFGEEVFALIRSWHNERAFHPTGPWSRLSVLLAYAAEASLFVRDLNLSPFNVGTRLVLDDFNLAQVAELNRLHGAPLRTPEELERFHKLMGGHPNLVCRGLEALAIQTMDLESLAERGGAEGGIFGSHLKAIRQALQAAPDLGDSLRTVLNGRSQLGVESFHRLRTAGLLVGASESEAKLRCGLYEGFLRRCLF